MADEPTAALAVEAAADAHDAEDADRGVTGAGRVVGPLVAALVLLVAVEVQVALAIDARIAGAVPDLALIAVVAIALRHGMAWGAVAGFMAGLLLDLAVQAPLGASAVVLTPIGALAGAFAERRRRVSLAMALVVLAVAAFLRGGGDVLVAAAIGARVAAWGEVAVIAVAAAMLTMLVGIALLPLLRRVLGVPVRSRA
jgi:rod shape-determining protein MreD